MNPWAKAIQDTMNSEVDKVPKGWLTRSQIQTLFGLQKIQTLERLRRLVGAGKCEVMPFKVRVGNAVRPVPHYKLK